MCVIAISEKGINPPTEQNLKDMFNYNDDGAGISYVLDGLVYTHKGLMSWADFSKTYKLVEKKLKTAGKTLADVPILYHFRIGTHGPNSEGLTHPFPISNNFMHLSATELSSDVVMAHNGIIHSVTPTPGWSDTQQYISDIVFPLIKHDKYFYKSKHLQKLLENTIDSSKLAFLDTTENFTLIGDWKQSDEPSLKGIKYSNLNHEYVAPAGYLYDYSFRSYDAQPSYRSFLAAPVPKGALLYKASQVDKNYEVKPNEVGYAVDEDYTYFVDAMGDLYRDTRDGILFLSSMYTYAFIADGDMLHAYHEAVVERGELYPVYSKSSMCV
jgi:hypothetical protein